MKIAVLGAGAMERSVWRKAVPYTGRNDGRCEWYADQSHQLKVLIVIASCCWRNLHLKAVKSGTDIGVQDLVIVFVKGIFTKDTIPAESVDDQQQHAGHDVAERRRQQP